MRFVRANEHRAIAIGLPYVLEGLLPSTCAQECALAYSNWRLELASAEYQKARIQQSHALAGVASLDVLAELGSTLQLKMNALNAEVNALKRHVTTADAEDEEDDRRSVASGPVLRNGATVFAGINLNATTMTTSINQSTSSLKLTTTSQVSN